MADPVHLKTSREGSEAVRGVSRPRGGPNRGARPGVHSLWKKGAGRVSHKALQQGSHSTRRLRQARSFLGGKVICAGRAARGRSVEKSNLSVADHELIQKIAEGSYGEVWL